MSSVFVENLDSLIQAVIALVFGYGAMLLRSRVKNENAKAIGERLILSAENAVREVQQTTVKQLKLDAEDGKLDKKDAARARDAAKTALKRYLGPVGLSELKKVAGGDLEALILGVIESQVGKTRGSFISSAIGTLEKEENPK